MYINDITVFILAIKQHSIDIDKISEKLNIKFKLNIKKCKFFQQKVKV